MTSRSILAAAVLLATTLPFATVPAIAASTSTGTTVAAPAAPATNGGQSTDREDRKAKRASREKRRAAEVAKLKGTTGCTAEAAVEQASKAGLVRPRIIKVRAKAIVLSGRVAEKADLNLIRIGKRQTADSKRKRGRVVLSRSNDCKVRTPRAKR